MEKQYVAKHSWRSSVLTGLLSLMMIVLFYAAKVDDMEPWLWLLGVVIVANGIFLYRNYKKRKEFL